jgi:ribonuclease HII
MAQDTWVCGLDEVGRGPLAGPLIAAAVVLPPGFVFSAAFPQVRFDDSKKLNSQQREKAADLIREVALVLTVEAISVDEINGQGIGWANRAVFERLIMRVDADRYTVDGNLKLGNLGRRSKRVRCLVRADATQQAVTAASIIAKVTRDRIMRDLHLDFPVYAWDHNVGYGTRAHVNALREHGPCSHHRRQFVTTALARSGPMLPGIFLDEEGS